MSVWGKKRSVMKHYDAVAKIYDLQYGREQRMKMEFALKNLHLKSKSLVLDVGCGTGILFEYLLDKVEILVGVDISKNILKKAKEKLEGVDNVFLIQADAIIYLFQMKLLMLFSPLLCFRTCLLQP